jgi:hypothetical protein
MNLLRQAPKLLTERFRRRVSVSLSPTLAPLILGSAPKLDSNAAIANRVWQIADASDRLGTEGREVACLKVGSFSNADGRFPERLYPVLRMPRSASA